MPATALALALTAAVLHAAWNLVVKSSGDRLVAAWAVVAGAGAVNVPLLVVLGPPLAGTYPYLVVSAFVHVGYNVLLATAYRHADLAVAYPIARGVAPLIVTLGGVALLADDVSVTGWTGVALISAGVGALALARRARAGYGWALATGAAIACYTLLDGAGVRAGDEAVRYIAGVFVFQTLLFSAFVLRVRGREATLLVVRYDWRRLVLGGIGSAGAYLLVMVAALSAPLGLVAGVRETSVLLAVVAGRRILREPVTLRHWLAVLSAFTGGLLIAVS